MKKYKLKKDLPTFKAGDIFTLNDLGLWKDTGEQVPILAYGSQVLKKFPNILTDWFEEVKEKKSVWDLEVGDPCYGITITDRGAVLEEYTFSSEPVYNGPMNARRVGALFTTKEEAWKYYHKYEAEAILKRDTHGFEPDWGNKAQDKYYVYYDHDTQDFGTDCAFLAQEPHIYFETKDEAVDSIKKHEKEWRAYFGIEEK